MNHLLPTRSLVIRMAGLGMPPNEIAVLLGMDASVFVALFEEVVQAAVLHAKLTALAAIRALAQAGKAAGILFWARTFFKKGCAAEPFKFPFLPKLRFYNHLGEVIG